MHVNFLYAINKTVLITVFVHWRRNRYAGGKRFVMVRKILEVKEITRIAEEATLARLMEKETESPSGKNFE